MSTDMEAYDAGYQAGLGNNWYGSYEYGDMKSYHEGREAGLNDR